MKTVERPRVTGTGAASIKVQPWVEYADYLEARLIEVSEERDELKWMREGLEK